MAAAVARESRGSPFLIEELVAQQPAARATRREQTLPVPTLEQMSASGSTRLPADARRLVEVVAVGGRPLPLAVARRGAAECRAAWTRWSPCSARAAFARTGLRDGREVVETTHDRIRETIVDAAPRHAAARATTRPSRARSRPTPGADPEAIAAHLLGAR